MNVNDTEELIKLLDAAITSDNAAIKQQLQSLLVTVSLVHGGEDSKFGPFRNILHRVTDLEYKLEQVTDYIQRHLVERHDRDRYTRNNTWVSNTTHQGSADWLENSTIKEYLNKMDDSLRNKK